MSRSETLARGGVFHGWARCKHRAQLVGAVLALGVVRLAVAQDGVVPAPSAPTPPPAEIMDSVMTDPDSQLFASILTAAELTLDDFDSKYVTFVVPRDSACTPAERSNLKGLRAKDAAKAYILNHAFEGSLAVVRDDEHDYHRVLRVNYFPDRKSMDGRVTIDEAHPLDMPLLSGKSVLISLSNGVVHVGGRSRMLVDFGAFNGAEIIVDQCTTL